MNMLTQYVSTTGQRRGLAVRILAGAGVSLLMLLGSGCAAERAPVQRQDNGAGYIGGSSSLTRVAPDKRKPAPIVSGPIVGGKRSLSTADYQGKVIVLNVWGSWCAPCRKEAPDLAKASKKTTGTAAFVGLNIRDPDPAPAEAFVRAFKVPYPSIYDPDARELVKFAGDLPPAGIPSTLIIDKGGRIAVRVIGVISEITLVDLIEEVNSGR